MMWVMFLLKHFQAIAIGLALIAVVATFESEHLRLMHLKRVYAACQADAKVYQASLRKLEGALALQDSRLQAAAIADYRTQAAATKAIARAQASQRRVSEQVAAIAAAQAGADQCKSADALILESVK